MRKFIVLIVLLSVASILKAEDYPYTWNSGIKFQITGAEVIGKELAVRIALTDTSRNSEVEFSGNKFRAYTSEGEELRVSYFSMGGRNENGEGVIKTKLKKGNMTLLTVTFRVGDKTVKNVKELTLTYMNYVHYRPYNVTLGEFEVNNETTKNPMKEFAVSDGVSMQLDKIVPNGTKLKLILNVKSEQSNKDFEFLVRSAVITDDDGNSYTCENASFDGKKVGMRDTVKGTLSTAKPGVLELNFDTVEYPIKNLATFSFSVNENLFNFTNVKIGS